jgi:hypothetical protein
MTRASAESFPPLKTSITGMGDTSTMSRISHPSSRVSLLVFFSIFASSLILSGVASAAALATPIGTTGSASGVTTSSATVSGTVNPNGADTTWYIQYGTSTSYGSQTSSQDVGSGTSSSGVSASLGGLSSDTTYHYRLVASSSGGTALGADASFKTSHSTAPGVETDNASNVGATSATLNGRVNPEGHSTTYYFEYGTSTSYGTKTTVANAGSSKTISASAALSGLAAGTTYHFRLVASSSSGTTAGNDRAFVTAGPPILDNEASQSVTTTTATLTGSVNPLGRSTSWYFEFGTSTSYGTKTPSQSAGSGGSPVAVSSPLASLTPGTVYHYRLVASSSAGTSLSSDLTFTTLQSVTLSASALRTISGDFVTLSGTVSSGQVGVSVSILSQPLGATSFASIATALSGAGGQWTYMARPKIQTSYEASASGGASPAVTVGVSPAISLRLITGARFSTRVVAGTSFAGRVVQLQRMVSDHWVTVKRATLNPKSSALFAASALPAHQSSTIRIAMSVNAAGPGYLGGFSRTITYRRS